MKEKLILALDTSEAREAVQTVKRLSPQIEAFKIGHALTLANGLGVIETLREAGAQRIFLDLKFHDIPHVIGLAVEEAARRGVWMLTVHASGGSAMMRAASEAAQSMDEPPLVIGVTVLTSLSEAVLKEEIGVARSLDEQAIHLAKRAQEAGLNGVVCSPNEAATLRQATGNDFLLVTPGIRLEGGEAHDQERTTTPRQAIQNGSNYLVVGRAVTGAPDPIAALERLVV